MGRALKQAFIGTILSGLLAGLMGCTSLLPAVEPTPQRKVIRTTPPPKVVKYKNAVAKKVVTKKVIVPTEEAPVTQPVIPTMGGGNGGSGSGSGGGGWSG